MIKALAVDVDDLPDAQRGDLALLLALAEDPRSLAAELTAGDRRVLRRRSELLDPAAPTWRRTPGGEDGYRALRILIEGP